MPPAFVASFATDRTVMPGAAKPIFSPLRSASVLNLPLSIRSLRMTTL